MRFLPGRYYLESRYNSNLAYFLLYICKYWGTIALFYLISSDVDFELNDALLFLLSLFLYFAVYDYFCFVNDQEPGALTVRTGDIVSKKDVIFQVSFVSLIGLAFFGDAFITPILVCVLISFIFHLHNKVSEKTRVITYFLLYIVKPFLFFQATKLEAIPVFIFAALYAFSYVPYYFVKKFRLTWPNKIFKFCLSGIILKITLLTLFLPYNLELVYIIFLQLSLTVIDYCINRKSRN